MILNKVCILFALIFGILLSLKLQSLWNLFTNIGLLKFWNFFFCRSWYTCKSVFKLSKTIFKLTYYLILTYRSVRIGFSYTMVRYKFMINELNFKTTLLHERMQSLLQIPSSVINIIFIWYIVCYLYKVTMLSPISFDSTSTMLPCALITLSVWSVLDLTPFTEASTPFEWVQFISRLSMHYSE